MLHDVFRVVWFRAVFLGYDTLSLDNQFLTFHWKIVPSSSWDWRSKKSTWEVNSYYCSWKI
jgi:hypothetical protein